MSSSESAGRRLGPTETFYHMMVEKYNACIYVQIVVIDSSEELSAHDVKKAFVILSEHQEAMRMRIVPLEDEDRAFRFTPMTVPVNVEVRLTRLREKSDWPHILKEENQYTLDCQNGPLWKVTMAHVENANGNNKTEYSLRHQCVLILQLHHAIADAKSVYDVVYRQFSPILSAVVNKRGTDGLIPKIPLSKSTEEVFSNQPSTGKKPTVPWYMKLFLDIFRWKNRTFGATYVFSKYFLYSDDPERTNKDIQDQPICQPLLLDEDLSSSVMRAAKRQGVTVHCIFLAVNSLALCATAKEAGVILPVVIKQAWPIDLRKHLGWTSPQPLSAHTSSGGTDTKKRVECGIGDFWEMCRHIQVGVKKQTTTKAATAVLGVVQYFIDASQNMPIMDIMTEIGMASITMISNGGIGDLGPAPPKENHDKVQIKVTEQYFSVLGMMRLNSMPFFHAVTTFNRKIAWNTTYDTRVVSKRFLDNYLGKVQELLWKYCGETAV